MKVYVYIAENNGMSTVIGVYSTLEIAKHRIATMHSDLPFLKELTMTEWEQDQDHPEYHYRDAIQPTPDGVERSETIEEHEVIDS